MVGMTDGYRQGIGGIGRGAAAWEQGMHHHSHLFLSGVAASNYRFLHQIGGVFGHREPGLRWG